MSLVCEIIEKNLDIFAGKSLLVTGANLDLSIISKLLEKTSYLTIFTSDLTLFFKLKNFFNIKENPNENLDSIYEIEDKNLSICYAMDPKDQLKRKYDECLLSITKSKPENIFLLNILKKYLVSDGFFITAGANDEGIKGIESSLKLLGNTATIDTARKCRLYKTLVKDFSDNQNPLFTYTLSDYGVNLSISQYPGVFSAKGLDIGTKTLLDYLNPNLNNLIKNNQNILDVCSGSGVIGLYLKAKNNSLNLTFADIYANALESVKINSQNNNLDARVIPSDMLDSTDKYDLIIANPPFHAGVNVVLEATLKLFRTAKDHLNNNGQLIIVANSFLPYTDYLKQYFETVNIVHSTPKFKIYQAF